MTHRRHTWSAGWLFALLLPALAIPPDAASSRPFVQVTRVTPRFAVAIPHVTRVRAANRGKIAEYTVPSPHCGPAGMTAGPDGQLWFVENLGNRLGEFDASTGTFTEYAIPSRNSSPVRITADAYGNVWFTEANANKIGEFTIATHTFAEYAVPTANSSPYDITTNGGGIWFTEQSGNNVGNLSHGAIMEYHVPTKNSAPIGMASDAHGTIWFAEYTGRKIGRLDAVTGTFTEYPIPANGVALELTAGAGGNTWFTVVKSDAIGRISERGEITEFQIPTPRSGPFAIGIGPDDAIWFAERGANKIARATLQGRVTNEYPVPTPESGAHSIVDGPNHDVWFTEFATNKLASITTN